MYSFLLLVAGMAILIVGGDILVRGAVGLAERFNVPALVIGLTIVAFGTSAPEMFVSVGAALRDAAGIAIGNVVGSNIANVLLVMALPALIAPTSCSEKGIGKNILVMIGMTMVFMGMLANGTVTRFDGIILLILLGLFVYDQYRTAMEHRAEAEAELADELGKAPHSPLIIAAMIVGGLVLLPVGAQFTVDGATAIAKSFGVSDAVIGLTIVAVGTSLPELATSLLAVWRGNTSVAVGNVVGSNIFNISSIMGITAAIVPVPVADRVISLDMWVMLAAALLVSALAHYNIKIGKRVASAMFGAYAVYVILSFAM